MNEIMTFVNEEFGSVRTVCINGEPWLVGKDVAVMKIRIEILSDTLMTKIG